MKIRVVLAVLNFLIVLQLPVLAQYDVWNHPDPLIRNRDKCWYEQQNNANHQRFLQNLDIFRSIRWYLCILSIIK
jgi:hypothetical protein